ncbi:DUF6036 family nucleotidyltransferase [Bdellovibrionota bacterium FG-2]
MGNLTREIMLNSLERLDQLIPIEVTLIVGGGGAMILAHGLTLTTTDIDAVPRGMDLSELDVYIKQVARELSLVPDWLNPYYGTFAHTLPSDYGDRLIEVFKGRQLTALALGLEEMLIMKCFAHRQKDVSHAKGLLKKGARIAQAEKHIMSLQKKGIPGAQEALDFLDDIQDLS